MNPIGPQARYFAALAEGRFEIQRCAACGRHVFQPRVLCPHCGAGDLEWVVASGRGTVHSTSVVRRRIEAGGDYNVALIDLDEGVRLMSRVDRLPPEAVAIGQRVAARIARDGDAPLLVFDPA